MLVTKKTRKGSFLCFSFSYIYLSKVKVIFVTFLPSFGICRFSLPLHAHLFRGKSVVVKRGPWDFGLQLYSNKKIWRTHARCLRKSLEQLMADQKIFLDSLPKKRVISTSVHLLLLRHQNGAFNLRQLWCLWTPNRVSRQGRNIAALCKHHGKNCRPQCFSFKRILRLGTCETICRLLCCAKPLQQQ